MQKLGANRMEMAESIVVLFRVQIVRRHQLVDVVHKMCSLCMWWYVNIGWYRTFAMRFQFKRADVKAERKYIVVAVHAPGQENKIDNPFDVGMQLRVKVVYFSLA